MVNFRATYDRNWTRALPMFINNVKTMAFMVVV